MSMKTYSILLICMVEISALSYNRPYLCPNAQWNPMGMTVISNATLGGPSRAIFVDDEDNIYALQHQRGQLIVQDSRHPNNISTINVGVVASYSGLFVSEEKEIYFESGQQPGVILKRSLNSSNNTVVTRFINNSYSLFIDLNNTLYSSLYHNHQIITIRPHENSTGWTTRAGDVSPGISSTQLHGPWAIFVDTNFDLYVADATNHRIQRFRHGERNATTVAGSSIPQNLSLGNPTDVIVDANSNIYIADNHRHRIVRVTAVAFQCLVGCFGTGSAANQLNRAYSVRFDSYGNLLVADEMNGRIQKFFLIHNCERHPYNRPQLCSYPTWNDTGIMILNNDTLASSPRGIFIDTNDTLYFADYNRSRILLWKNGSTNHNFTVIPSVPLLVYSPLFVTGWGEIYFAASSEPGAVMKTSVHNSTTVNVTTFSGDCYGLFIDVDGTLYCSLRYQHRIETISLKNNSTQRVIRAGNSTNGFTPNQLSEPWGIFVDINFDLYVADSLNHRIQRFRPNESHVVTVAGQEIPNGLLLNRPTDVIVDGHNHLYIADTRNHRVIRVTSSDYQCLAGCDCRSGSGANQFHNVYSLHLDSIGNLYVVDEMNNRIQKLLLLPNCAQSAMASGPTECSMLSTWTSIEVTSTASSVLSVAPSLHYSPCDNATHIGSYCNITTDPCLILTPCLNGGSCVATNQSGRGYRCLCLSGFNGTDCQLDQRPCHSNLCLNNGTCQVLFNGTEACQCAQGWRGDRCEKRVDFCQNITCENQGVCRSLVMDYRCECLGDSYWGRHCEIEALRTMILRLFARSMAHIAIIIIIGTALVIVTMDVLKYFCAIGVADSKKAKPPRRTIKIVHHVYVNAPKL